MSMNLERCVDPRALIMSRAGMLSFSSFIATSSFANDRASVFIYTLHWVPSVIARYSTAAVDSSVASCSRDNHPADIPLYVINPRVIGLRSVRSPAQSALELADIGLVLNTAPTLCDCVFLPN